MNHPFAIGQSYDRTILLSFVGSKQGQSGIIWGAAQPTVVICTSGGRHGAKAGYEDHQNIDGTWDYFGQGENGDQDPMSFANKLLVDGERSILFFKTREPTSAEVQAAGNWKKRYTFMGEYCTGAWDLIVPTIGRRQGNQLIKFLFVPAGDSPVNATEETYESTPAILESREKLRHRLTELGAKPKRGKQILREYYVRSGLLKAYVKLRAAGFCELCDEKAPFLTESNEPYLEIHHIFRLADDGPDSPENVAGICPNCHRRTHHGQDRFQIQTALASRIKQKEHSLNQSQ